MDLTHASVGSSSTGTGPEVFSLEDDQGETSMKSLSLFHFPWWRVDATENPGPDGHYLIRTRMKDKPGEALLVDPGSPENLCGDEWSKRQQEEARKAGRPNAVYTPLPRQLEVGGVGTGTQIATRSVKVHLGLQGGKEGTYEAPELPNSSTPALLGQRSLRKARTLLDCFNNKMYCIGSGGYRLHLSPGSEMYQLEESCAGHLMLPCSQFSTSPTGGRMAMMTEAATPVAEAGLEQTSRCAATAEVARGSSVGGQSGSSQALAAHGATL